MRVFVERLIAFEAKSRSASAAKTPTAFLVCDKLRPHLVTLMGNAGFRALLMRARSVACGEVDSLRAVQVNEDGCLEELANLQTQNEPEFLDEGGVVLVAQLLGLLVAFIGENLTLRLVREVWPKVTVYDLDFNKGDKNEKTK